MESITRGPRITHWPAPPQVSWSPERQQAVCQKLHTRVEMPETVRLERFLASSGARPPLPGGARAEPGKENEQQAANAEVGSPRAAAAAGSMADAAHTRQQRPLAGMQARTGGSFYGSGGSTAAASSGLLSPLGLQTSMLQVFKRCGTPAAFKGARCGCGLSTVQQVACTCCPSFLADIAGHCTLPRVSVLHAMSCRPIHLSMCSCLFAVLLASTTTPSCSRHWPSACWSASPASSMQSSRAQCLRRQGGNSSSSTWSKGPKSCLCGRAAHTQARRSTCQRQM